jgi:hypothetical protein
VTSLQLPSHFQPLAQSPLDFSLIGLGKLVSDAFPRNVARQLRQVQRQFQPLLGLHPAVHLNLHVQGRLRRHVQSLTAKEGTLKPKNLNPHDGQNEWRFLYFT